MRYRRLFCFILTLLFTMSIFSVGFVSASAQDLPRPFLRGGDRNLRIHRPETWNPADVIVGRIIHAYEMP